MKINLLRYLILLITIQFLSVKVFAKKPLKPRIEYPISKIEFAGVFRLVGTENSQGIRYSKAFKEVMKSRNSDEFAKKILRGEIILKKPIFESYDLIKKGSLRNDYVFEIDKFGQGYFFTESNNNKRLEIYSTANGSIRINTVGLEDVYIILKYKDINELTFLCYSGGCRHSVESYNFLDQLFEHQRNEKHFFNKYLHSILSFFDRRWFCESKSNPMVGRSPYCSDWRDVRGKKYFKTIVDNDFFSSSFVTKVSKDGLISNLNAFIQSRGLVGSESENCISKLERKVVYKIKGSKHGIFYLAISFIEENNSSSENIILSFPKDDYQNQVFLHLSNWGRSFSIRELDCSGN